MPLSPANKGFTLIELVTVIVTLGVLTAIALPKFIDMTREARIAKLNGMAAALHSAAQLWNAACIVTPDSNCLGITALHENISRNGVSVNVSNGFPNAGDNLNRDQIDILVSTRGFLVSISDYSITRFAIPDVAAPSQCAVTYCESSGISNTLCYPNSYRVEITNTGC